jgi:hypothetical protein
VRTVTSATTLITPTPPTTPITKKPKTLHQATLFTKAPLKPINTPTKAMIQDIEDEVSRTQSTSSLESLLPVVYTGVIE